MTDSEQTEWEPPVVEPREGETYMDAYTRVMHEAAGITPDEEAEPLGVLTGQVPVRSMPIAMEDFDDADDIEPISEDDEGSG